MAQLLPHRLKSHPGGPEPKRWRLVGPSHLLEVKTVRYKEKQVLIPGRKFQAIDQMLWSITPETHDTVG